MINNHKNISKYKSDPPKGNKPRKITNGPIYTKDEVRELSGPRKLEFGTKRSGEDAADLGFSAHDIADLITLALDTGSYHDSEWCIQNSQKNLWAACDAHSFSI